jgi:hypothetical protein
VLPRTFPIDDLRVEHRQRRRIQRLSERTTGISSRAAVRQLTAGEPPTDGRGFGPWDV